MIEDKTRRYSEYNIYESIDELSDELVIVDYSDIRSDISLICGNVLIGREEWRDGKLLVRSRVVDKRGDKYVMMDLEYDDQGQLMRVMQTIQNQKGREEEVLFFLRRYTSWEDELFAYFYRDGKSISYQEYHKPILEIEKVIKEITPIIPDIINIISKYLDI